MKQTLFATTLLVFLLSCKKDKVPVPVEAVMVEGNFLCEVVDDYSYTNQYSDTEYDFVFALTIENDSIRFNGYAFPLSSYDTLTGAGSHTLYIGTVSTVRLTLADHFKHLDYFANFPSQLAGPSTSKSIIGTRTEFEPTTNLTTPLLTYSGNYLLYQQVYENFNGINNETTASAYATYSAGSEQIVVDGVSRPLPLCHSHYSRQQGYSLWFYENINTEVYWTNDSLYYHWRRIYGDPWNPPLDTAHYHYQGHRL